MTAEVSVRDRLRSWMFSSGGSAMLDDDKNPRHLLFLVAQELARVDLEKERLEAENEKLMSMLDCHAGFCSHHVECNGPVARHRRAEEVMRRNDDHSLAEP